LSDSYYKWRRFSLNNINTLEFTYGINYSRLIRNVRWTNVDKWSNKETPKTLFTPNIDVYRYLKYFERNVVSSAFCLFLHILTNSIIVNYIILKIPFIFHFVIPIFSSISIMYTHTNSLYIEEHLNFFWRSYSRSYKHVIRFKYYNHRL
jgi:hypothetical protein